MASHTPSVATKKVKSIDICSVSDVILRNLFPPNLFAHKRKFEERRWDAGRKTLVQWKLNWWHKWVSTRSHQKKSHSLISQHQQVLITSYESDLDWYRLILPRLWPKFAAPAPAIVLPAPSPLPPNTTSKFVSLTSLKSNGQERPVDIPVVSMGSLKGLPQRLTLRCDEVPLLSQSQCNQIMYLPWCNGNRFIKSILAIIFSVQNNLEWDDWEPSWPLEWADGRSSLLSPPRVRRSLPEQCMPWYFPTRMQLSCLYHIFHSFMTFYVQGGDHAAIAKVLKAAMNGEEPSLIITDDATTRPFRFFRTNDGYVLRTVGSGIRVKEYACPRPPGLVTRVHVKWRSCHTSRFEKVF